MHIDNSECLRNFGNFIKEARTSQGCFQADIAEAVGIKQPYYSQIEAGTRNVDLVLAMKICKALKVDLSDYIHTYL